MKYLSLVGLFVVAFTLIACGPAFEASPFTETGGAVGLGLSGSAGSEVVSAAGAGSSEAGSGSVSAAAGRAGQGGEGSRGGASGSSGAAGVAGSPAAAGSNSAGGSAPVAGAGGMPSMGGGGSAAGGSASAGAPEGGAGASASGSSGMGGAGGTTSVVPCDHAIDVMGKTSYHVGADAACLKIDVRFDFVACSYWDDRPVTVNGFTTQCWVHFPVPMAIDGAYYLSVPVGTNPQATVSWTPL